MKTSIAIVLINYNTITHTLECLQSINNINTEHDIKVFVIDNNSNDDCDTHIKKIQRDLYYSISIINSMENLGFSGGCKLGIDAAIKEGFEYILLLNNDTTVKNDFLDKLLEPYHLFENIGITTAKILDYYDNNLMQYDGANLSKYKGTAEIYGFGKPNNKNDSKYIDCTFASGCCMLIKTDTIKKYGFMKDDYFLYYEDVEYCHRMVENGLRIVYVPSAIIYHKESVSTNKKSLLYSYYFSRNRLTFIKENLVNPYKSIAFLYTISWFIKKIIFNELTFKGVMIGICDSYKNIKGKKVI